MSTTGTVALTEIRRKLNDITADDDGVYRWPTASLVVYMNAVINLMSTRHTEYFAGSSLPTSPVAKLTEASLSANLPFTDAGLNFFTDMVTAKAQMEDGESSANRQRAQDQVQMAALEA